MFQNGISRNTKCAVKDGFRRDSHIRMYHALLFCGSNKNLYVIVVQASFVHTSWDRKSLGLWQLLRLVKISKRVHHQIDAGICTLTTLLALLVLTSPTSTYVCTYVVRDQI